MFEPMSKDREEFLRSGIGPQIAVTSRGYQDVVDAERAETWAEVDRLRRELERLRVALKDVAVGLECDCDEAYVKRGRHEPNALCYLLPDVLAALNPEVAS